MLISAPAHELRQIADQKVWNTIGVAGLRQLISDWTGGSWPLSSASGMQPNIRTQMSEHISPQQMAHSEPSPTEAAEISVTVHSKHKP